MALIASLVGGSRLRHRRALAAGAGGRFVGPEPWCRPLAVGLFTNSSRMAAFRRLVDPRRAAIALSPRCRPARSAPGLQPLSGKGALIVIGGMLVATVAAAAADEGAAGSRSPTARSPWPASPGDHWAGGTVGAGILLLRCDGGGARGAAVVATDAADLIGIGLTKFATFGLAGAVTAQCGGRAADRLSWRSPAPFSPRRWSTACPCISTLRCSTRSSPSAARDDHHTRSYAEYDEGLALDHFDASLFIRPDRNAPRLRCSAFSRWCASRAAHGGWVENKGVPRLTDARAAEVAVTFVNHVTF